MLINSNLNNYFFIEHIKYLNHQINPGFKKYILNKIIPIYNQFDPSHKPDHIYDVIENSFLIADKIKQDTNQILNANILIASAAYHDIGRIHGSENHHINSKKIILKDRYLNTWLNKDEVLIIADACFNHDEYNPNVKRTIYSKILFDADNLNDYNVERLIKRAWNYRKTNNPNLTDEEILIQSYEYLQEKYGDKINPILYLPQSHELIKDNVKLKNKALSDFRVYKKLFTSMIQNHILSS